jgi:hypothetical protein
MTTPTLVYIHGRGQEFKDPVKLLASWQNGLANGLRAAAVDPLTDLPAVLPFYANVLYQAAAEIEQRHTNIDLEAIPKDPDVGGPLHPALGKKVGTVERQLLSELLDEKNVPPPATDPDDEGIASWAGKLLGWGPLRTGLISLAEVAKVDRDIIKAFLKDVAVYLAGPGVRMKVLETVRAGIPADGPIILVSHSLGTVVACDLLNDDTYRSRTIAWVTLGSPLGLPVVRRNLLAKGAHPTGIDWQSGYDPHDVVALGHPLLLRWGPALADVKVDNGDAPHSIELYLGHREIAAFIAKATTDA